MINGNCSCCSTVKVSLASHTLLAKNKAEGSGDRAYNVSFHSPCIGGETYFMCTCYMWMSQVVVRVVEPAMERVPEIVMVAIVCQRLNPSQKQVHMRYVSPPIHGEWNETLYARSPDPSALFFARRVWLARLSEGHVTKCKQMCKTTLYLLCCLFKNPLPTLTCTINTLYPLNKLDNTFYLGQVPLNFMYFT